MRNTNYSPQDVKTYLSKKLNVPSSSLSDDSRISYLAKDSLDLFDLELSLEEEYSLDDVNIRDKTRTVSDLIRLITS